MKTIFLKLFSSFLSFAIILILSMALIINPSFLNGAFAYQKNSELMTEQQILTQLEQLDNTYVKNEQQHMRQLLNGINAHYASQPTTDVDTLTAFLEMNYVLSVVDASNTIINSTDASLIGNTYIQPLSELTVSSKTSDARYTFVLQTIHYESTYLQTIVKSTLKHNDILRDLVIWNVHDETTSRLFEENDTLSDTFARTLHDQRSYTLNVEKGTDYVEKHQFIPYKLDDKTSAVHRIIYLKFDNKEPLKILTKYHNQIQIVMLISFLIALVVTAVILKLLYKTIYLAKYDSLTQIFNRASYDDMMDKLFRKKRAQPIGLMLIDLDNFKQLNDALGHSVGDEALVELTTLLKDVTSRSSYAYRFGGDEFAIVFEQASEQLLTDKAHALLRSVEQLQQQLPHWQLLSISIGATLQNEQRNSARTLFEEADKALYASKRQGKACYTFVC